MQASEGDGTFHLCIQNFLLSYCRTRHATTGTTQAKLFLHTELHTRLSLVYPDISLHVTNNQTKMKTKFRTLSPGDKVLARDHLQRKVVHKHYCYRTRFSIMVHPPGWWPSVVPWHWWCTGRAPSEPDCSTASPHCHWRFTCCPRTFNTSSVLMPHQNCGAPSFCLYRILKLLPKASREPQPVVEQAAMQTDASGPQSVPKVNMTPQPFVLCHYNSKETDYGNLRKTVSCLWTLSFFLGHYSWLLTEFRPISTIIT